MIIFSFKCILRIPSKVVNFVCTESIRSSCHSLCNMLVNGTVGNMVIIYRNSLNYDDSEISSFNRKAKRNNIFLLS